MIAREGGRPSRIRARFVIGALDALGFGGAFAPGSGRRDVLGAPVRGQRLHHRRRALRQDLRPRRSAPHLFLGGPTIGWAHAAFRAMRRFDDPRVAWRANTPILIVASGADRVTDCAAAERFAARLEPGSLIVIDGAEHEILIERDALRDQFWAAFDAFVPGSGADALRDRDLLNDGCA